MGDPYERRRWGRRKCRRNSIGAGVWVAVGGGVLVVMAAVGVLVWTIRHRDHDRGGKAPEAAQAAAEGEKATPAPVKAPTTWVRATVPGTTLSVEMPRMPKSVGPWSNGNSNVQVGNAVVFCKFDEPGESGWTYEVLCVTTAHSDPGMQKVVEADNGVVRDMKLPIGTTLPLGGQIVRKLEVGGRPAIVTAVNVPQGRQVRMRLAESGARGYTCTVIGPGVSEDHPDVRRFFESARFN